MIDPSLLTMRTGNDESTIAVPVLQVRLGMQSNVSVIGMSNLKGEVHHPAAYVQTPISSIDGHSSDDEVVFVIKNAQRTDRATVDRRPHYDRRGVQVRGRLDPAQCTVAPH